MRNIDWQITNYFNIFRLGVVFQALPLAKKQKLLPRLYHRMAVGIEEAGFEVKDQLQWLFGVSLPKSHNISKGIDKLFKAERTVVGENPNRKGRINWDNNPKNITLPATEAGELWEIYKTEPQRMPDMTRRAFCGME